MIVIPGSTNITAYLFIVGDASNASPGDPVTGLDETDITTFAYTRERTVETTFAAAALASPSAAHTDGGFEEVDATNAPGLYRVDLPDAAVATGSPFARITAVVAGASNARSEPIEITLNDANAIWDAPGSSHLVADSMGEKMAALAPVETFVEAAPSPTATAFAIDDITMSDDSLIDAILVFIDGDLIGQARRITGNTVNGTNVLAFDVPWTFEGADGPPAANDRCVVIQGSVARGVADAVWDELIASRLDGTPGRAAGALVGLAPAQNQTPAIGGTPTSTAFDTGLTEANDFWNGQFLTFIEGNLAGQSRRITDFVNTNGRITVSPAFAAAPAVDSEFTIVASEDILGFPMVELAAVPGATPDFVDGVMWLYMKTRNLSITDDTGSPTKHQVHKDDGTKIADADVSDTGAGGKATRAKYV